MSAMRVQRACDRAQDDSRVAQVSTVKLKKDHQKKIKGSSGEFREAQESLFAKYDLETKSNKIMYKYKQLARFYAAF